MIPLMRSCCTLFCVLCLLKLDAQSGNISPLSIRQIMQGEGFVGSLPDNFRWSADAKTLYFDWNPDSLPAAVPYAVSQSGRNPKRLSLAQERGMILARGPLNEAGTLQIQVRNGDLYLYDRLQDQSRQLTQTIEAESDPIFNATETAILFQRGGDVYSFRLADGFLRQLTHFQASAKGGKAAKSKQDQWLERQQLELFDILEQRQEKSDWQKKRQDSLKIKRPRELNYPDVESVAPAPDERFVVFRLRREESRATLTQVPDYVSKSGYTSNLSAREKVGSPLPVYESYIYDGLLDTVYPIRKDSLEGILQKPAFLAEYHNDSLPYNPQYKMPRAVLVSDPIFSPFGRTVVVVRSLDYKDRWICQLDLASGALRLLDRQRDEAWVGGPGISSSYEYAGNIGWMPGYESIYFQSEKSGYSNLYEADLLSGEIKPILSGEFEVLQARLSLDKQAFYISANAEGPGQVHFYKLPLEGRRLQKLTQLPGRHDVTLSPDEKTLAIRYSYSNRPWELYLQENKAGAPAKRITHSTKLAFEAYPWRDPEIISFMASDGKSVPARLYRPAKGTQGSPAVLFVHGAGYLQNVHQWWSQYYREYMFHNLLADNGYTVIDIDYRASSGYGRDWRTAIYRHMGGRDLQDYLDAAAFLRDSLGTDPQRMGIYGGSYGGFITLMALCTAPGTFSCGAALRSVTDWAHYNEGYTGPILNTPVEDSMAFRRSSPIYFADKLQGELLMLHGAVDTNVHYQDVIRFSQRLIELGKEHWQLVAYPVEDHAFAEPSSWADEYRRIFELFQAQIGSPP